MIRLSRSALSIHESILVNQVLDSGFLGAGEFTQRFESELSDFLQSQVTVVNSGTTALILALQVAGVQSGEIVIVPSLTYLATIQAITALGAIPFFVDINKFGQIDPSKIPKEALISAKALIPVHYAGREIDLSYIFSLSDKYGFRVIEDSAHSFGSVNISPLNERRYDLVCYSFDGIKNITSAEGGAVCSFNTQDHQRLQNIRFLGVIGDSDKRSRNKRTWSPQVIEQGWRAHMSNVNAAIGLAQLKRRNELWSRRKSLSSTYHHCFSSSTNFSPLLPNDNRIVPHIYPVYTNNHSLDVIINHLSAHDIEVGRHYYPNHYLDFFSGFPSGDLSITEDFYRNTLSLPLHPLLEQSDVNTILAALSDFL